MKKFMAVIVAIVLLAIIGSCIVSYNNSRSKALSWCYDHGYHDVQSLDGKYWCVEGSELTRVPDGNE